MMKTARNLDIAIVVSGRRRLRPRHPGGPGDGRPGGGHQLPRQHLLGPDGRGRPVHGHHRAGQGREGVLAVGTAGRRRRRGPVDDRGPRQADRGQPGRPAGRGREWTRRDAGDPMEAEPVAASARPARRRLRRPARREAVRACRGDGRRAWEPTRCPRPRASRRRSIGAETFEDGDASRRRRRRRGGRGRGRGRGRGDEARSSRPLPAWTRPSRSSRASRASPASCASRVSRGGSRPRRSSAGPACAAPDAVRVGLGFPDRRADRVLDGRTGAPGRASRRRGLRRAGDPRVPARRAATGTRRASRGGARGGGPRGGAARFLCRGRRSRAIWQGRRRWPEIATRTYPGAVAAAVVARWSVDATSVRRAAAGRIGIALIGIAPIVRIARVALPSRGARCRPELEQLVRAQLAGGRPERPPQARPFDGRRSEEVPETTPTATPMAAAGAAEAATEAPKRRTTRRKPDAADASPDSTAGYRRGSEASRDAEDGGYRGCDRHPVGRRGGRCAEASDDQEEGRTQRLPRRVT